MMDAIGDARAIAERILLGNIAERVWGGTSRRVLLTGGMKYLELWGRDSAASMSRSVTHFGALTLRPSGPTTKPMLRRHARLSA